MATRILTDTDTIAWDEATANQVKGNVVDGSVTNAKLADMAQGTIKGRQAAGGTGNPEDLTQAQAKTVLGLEGTSTDNAVVRFNGTDGDTQNSGVTIDDDDDVSGVNDLDMDGDLTVGGDVTVDGDLAATDGSFTNITQTGYTDIAEISAPASPAANVARAYAADDGNGVTTVGHKDSGGNIVPWSHYLTSSTGGVTRTQYDKLSDFRSVKDFGAVGDATEVTTGCGISSSDTTLTAPASTFEAADVGKVICVVGAGTAGANLYTTIAAFTDTDEVELTDAASTTVSNGAIIFGTDDTAAIQAALTAGRLCLVPPGSYITTDQLVLTSADVLYGLGKPKIYPLISSKSAIGPSDLTTLTTANRVFDIRIENLHFDGAGSESSIGIDLTQCLSAICRNVLSEDFATGFRLRGICYYTRLSICTAQNCDTSYHIHNDGADLSGPNHLTLEYCRVNLGDVGFFIDEDGDTALGDIYILHPAVESLNEDGICFRINADNFVRQVVIDTPRIDVSNTGIVGFQFDDIANTERVSILSPNIIGVSAANRFSPAITDTTYIDKVRVFSSDRDFTPQPEFRVLASSAAAVTHTGNTTETTLATIVVPASSMGNNGILRITTLWSYNAPSDVNNKTARVKLGSTTFSTTTLNSASATGFRHQCEIMNRNNAASQVTQFNNTNSFNIGGANQTGTENTNNELNITITGQLASGSDTITLESYIVEILAKS